MKNNRRIKIIIVAAGIMAAAIALGVVLACAGSPPGETVRKAGQEKSPEKVTAEAGTEKERRPGSQEKERRTYVLDATVHEDQQRSGSTAVRDNEEHGESECTVMPDYEKKGSSESTVMHGYAGHQETESSSVSGTAGHQEPRTEAEPTAHVHSYELADTRTVEHPAVTEQVWVEDSPAWDEVIRDGYHVCVVTCHECGSQFADSSQANALEAWGDHIDAGHDGDGGYDMAASYDVPAEVVHHEAAGHYETRTISAAWTEYVDTYRCSCGDTYTQAR